MTSIGTVINTHTGPARVVVMVPVGVRPNGEEYSQALTQAVGGDSVAASAAAAAAAAQDGTPGATSGLAPSATAGSAAVATQAAVQAVFILDPHAITASPNGTDPSSDPSGQNNSGQDATSQDGGNSGTQTKDGKDSTGSADATSPSGKEHWQPSGLAKIAAMYRNTEKLAASHEDTAASGEHVSIIG